LDHEVLDDTVESGALVSESLLASRQRAEVFGGLSCVSVSSSTPLFSPYSAHLWNGLAIQAHHYPAHRLVIVSDVEVHLENILAYSFQPMNPLNRTLWVIFGPLAASEDCAKKAKVKVRIRSNEIATRCREAMIATSASRF
jgi:hypothetical protein